MVPSRRRHRVSSLRTVPCSLTTAPLRHCPCDGALRPHKIAFASVLLRRHLCSGTLATAPKRHCPRASAFAATLSRPRPRVNTIVSVTLRQRHRVRALSTARSRQHPRVSFKASEPLLQRSFSLPSRQRPLFSLHTRVNVTASVTISVVIAIEDNVLPVSSHM